jgi:hypothetical protein
MTTMTIHTERVETQNGRQIVQTARHHRYCLDTRDPATNDFVCVRCGTTGHFSYILDYKPCEPFYVGLDHVDDDADPIGNPFRFDDVPCRDLDSVAS